MYPELQKQQLSKNFLITLDTESTDVIIRNYFAPTGDAQYQALRAMIATIKQDLAKAKKQTKRPSYLPANNHRAKTDDTYYNPTEFLMYQLVWHSLVDFPEEKTVATSTSNYSSGSYSGSSGSSRSSSHEDTSSSSSSSNCSSSSCSSSSCSSSSCGSSCSS